MWTSWVINERCPFQIKTLKVTAPDLVRQVFPKALGWVWELSRRCNLHLTRRAWVLHSSFCFFYSCWKFFCCFLQRSSSCWQTAEFSAAASKQNSASGSISPARHCKDTLAVAQTRTGLLSRRRCMSKGVIVCWVFPVPSKSPIKFPCDR